MFLIFYIISFQSSFVSYHKICLIFYSYIEFDIVLNFASSGVRDILILDKQTGERNLVIGAGDGVVELVRENENHYKNVNRVKSPSYPLLSVVSCLS